MSSSERGLHDLLEGFCVAQRNDIDLYCTGHLNHNRLQKPKEIATHKPWESYLKDMALVSQPSKLPSPKRSGEKENMSKALYDFSVGTSGSLPLPSIVDKEKDSLSKNERQAVHSRNREKDTTSRMRPNSVASYISDNMYIEELEIPDLMLPTGGIQNHRKSQLTELNLLQNERQGKWGKHRFLTTHLGAITKKDQFEKMREFDRTVLRKHEMREPGVLTGRNAVEHLERKLFKNLQELGSLSSSSPNFHRLQVYSDIWDDMVQDTPTFSKILKAIKVEYDTYMGSLLDTQPQKLSQVLYKQVRGLAASGTSIPGQVTHEQQTVHQLQDEVKELLLENDRFRKSVRDEQHYSEEPLPKFKQTQQLEPMPSKDKDVDSFEEQITALHFGILELLKEMKAMRQQVHNDYVPSVVCKHLEHGVKEMEIAILKVLSTNEYLGKTIQQLEIDIEKVMEKTGIEDAESRQVWKAINTLSVPVDEDDCTSTPR